MTITLKQGDCLELMKELPDESVNAVITDPPYNIGIADWDKINEYEDWLIKVFKECERVLKKNGTLWFFHMRFETLADIHNRLQKETSLRHKQLIIIDKGLQSIAGRTGKTLRSYPRATEYLQFYTFDDPTGAEQLGDIYAKVNPMAKYLKEEFKRAGVSNIKLAKLFPSKTGGLTGCVSNWVMGLNFPLKEQYETMRAYLNKEKDYGYLSKEYEDLRKEYEDLRYTFNLQEGFTDVWRINFYQQKVEHASPKPIPLMSRIIKTATKEGDTILDPFIGSGTTGVACVQLNRNFIGYEISPNYFKMAEKRIKEAETQRKLNEFKE